MRTTGLEVTVDTTLNNLNITCSVADGSPCISVSKGVTLAINTCEIKASTEHTGVGIKLHEKAILHMLNVQVFRFKGYSIYCEGKLDCSNVDIHIEDSTFTENTAEKGTISILEADFSTSLTILTSRFENNKATEGCGGAVHANKVSHVNIQNTEFSNNEAYKKGGAVCIIRVNAVRITNSSFIENIVKTLTGGGLFMSYIESGIIKSSRFIGNEAFQKGGGLSLKECKVGVKVYDDVVVKGNKITGT